ncbi:sigma54 specific transcriptional regulator, Fis family [Alkaliphilus metalliredigens QYMF]|uniref:Sigma54 specific transcriptional regulator, Fis family n=1 Tax=Alkaliphilus metalliredigens (strain QYMF) TaxID=293826 RepID=A6TW17_ALKMQ|nr:sigma-54-dependent Fis family transcriptional regulator [Alkaliphilus metalliredigens]ABR50385.1 sigma54 specific transcriptional regulator, Fis family [Alkaliphilus metalliredigens QYMF]
MKKELDVILHSTNDAMIAIDILRKITLFNRAAEKITGLKESEVLGKNVEDVVMNTRLPYVLETGESELNRRQHWGDTIIITSRMPVKDEVGHVIGAVAVFRDISEITDLTHEIYQLKEMQCLLEAIFHSTQDAITVCDQHGMGVLINPAYTRLTGLTEKDVIGKPATVDLAEGESVHMRVLKTRKPVKSARLKVGPLNKDVIADAAPIIVDGELRGSVGVLHDLTEISKLNKELMQAKQIIRKLEARYTFEDIIVSNEKMITAIQKAEQAAATPATVLLRGESGTGKELFAHAIHNSSKRKYNQFVRVNCAAISEGLLESELFGYEEGAFTGARKGGKVGLFEEAHGGTIFLDEIGEIPMNTQAKLLRVLQEKEVLRVGATNPIIIDVRVIAATNVHLEKAVELGKFREDLYYRLNVIPINIPPLRQRKKDIHPLVLHLIKKFNEEYGRKVDKVDHGALIRLMEYDWPGNVRELQNYIGRAMLNMKYQEDTLEENHLPKFFDNDQESAASQKQAKDQIEVDEGESLKEAVEKLEKQLILRTLTKSGGNRTQAARVLKVSIRNLYYKMEKYHIEAL